jgi:signal transduction histidine kinase
MLQPAALQTYIKLSEKITSIDDPSIQLNGILVDFLVELNQLGYQYQNVNILIIDAQNKVVDDFFYDPEVTKNEIVKFEIVPGQTIFHPNSEIEKEMLWGKIMISSDIIQIVNQSYPLKHQLRTVVFVPLISASHLKGSFILTTKRGADQISQDEQDFLKLVGQLVNFTYRLFETQNSLVHVSQEVYKANSELHKVNKLKDDFVSIASHELRTPMTAIRSYAWMALHRSDVPLSDKLKRYLERTLISTERLINLVNDMLNVSRIESGRIEIAPTAFDLSNLIGEVLIEIDAKAKEKGLTVTHQANTIPKMFADENKVHQILLNLLGNSLKFTPTGGTISISYQSDGQNISVSVKDSGIGISTDDLNRLFKKFSRLDNSYVATASTGGTGLGLFICKSLIDLMKGTINVQSAGENQGTTFTFTLPVATPKILAEAEKYHYKPPQARLLEPVAIQAYPNEPA